MLIGVDVYHAKMRFIEKLDVYVQRRSVGAFVSVFINVNTGEYITSNHVVEVKAKVELFCKAESDSETSSVKSDSKNSSAIKIMEAPEITREETLRTFVERSIADHKITPDQIIVYRDGVGDSMLECVVCYFVYFVCFIILICHQLLIFRARLKFYKFKTPVNQLN
jgi:hypothetical protein